MADPQEELLRHTAQRMANLGGDMAQNVAGRHVRAEIKRYLPHFLWPLIPGEGGSVQLRVQHMAERKASDLLWKVGCTAGFFGIFGLALCVIAVAVLSVLWQSGALGRF